MDHEFLEYFGFRRRQESTDVDSPTYRWRGRSVFEGVSGGAFVQVVSRYISDPSFTQALNVLSPEHADWPSDFIFMMGVGTIVQAMNRTTKRGINRIMRRGIQQNIDEMDQPGWPIYFTTGVALGRYGAYHLIEALRHYL